MSTLTLKSMAGLAYVEDWQAAGMSDREALLKLAEFREWSVYTYDCALTQQQQTMPAPTDKFYQLANSARLTLEWAEGDLVHVIWETAGTAVDVEGDSSGAALVKIAALFLSDTE